MSEPPRPSDPTPAKPPHTGITESPEELRQRNLHEKEQHDDAKSAALGAAAGLGCIAFPLLPWLIGALVFLAILIAWSFHTYHHG